MLITILSLVAGLFFLFSPISIPTDTWLIPGLMVLAATTILIIFPIINNLNLLPLQRLEQQLIPSLLERFRKDTPLNMSRFFIYAFSLLSYVTAIVWISLDFSFKLALLAVWIVLFGLTLDLMRDTFKRVTTFLNPFHFIDLTTYDAKRSIKEENDHRLFESLDALSEIGIRSIQDSKLALGLQTLDAFPSILQTFFASSKSIARINQDQKIKQETGRDEASYTVFYILQRIELMNSKALEYGLWTICNRIIMILGKIIVYSAKFDLSMVSFPVHVLGKFALKALQYHFNEVAALATSTLLEVSKTIVKEIDLTYQEIAQPFDTIINNLNAIAQATFKKDKNLNPRLLAQPFKELKELFQSEKVAQHQDTPVILQHLDTILGEFEALEQVMRTIPPIPTDVA